MAAYIGRRIIGMIVVLFAVSVVTFLLMHAIPGGPFDSEKKLPPEIIDNLKEKYNLDAPLIEQYTNYIGGIVIPHIERGKITPSQQSDYLIIIDLGNQTYFKWINFGPTYKSKTRSVNDIFREQFPVSAQLGVWALLIALCIGLPLGTLAALNRNKPIDYMAMGVAITGVSVPVIVLGPILIWMFGVNLRLFPVTGWGTPANVVMPAFALGFASSALIARLTRASLLEVLSEDYIRTARAKGLGERVVITIHALKNSLIPVVTVIGPLFAALVTGTFVTETIFGIPGMGRYFVTSITNRDYPVIMGTVLLYAMLLVIANVLVDITYAWLDPRIRYT
ncbi:Dipeptide transport system permease protein DppB [Anaerolineae bacterium]|nr:Dipeptide transport system permease protein DppB [Anaerolineae bacterium]